MAEIKRYIHKDILERITSPSSFLQILIGPRQVGKTTLIRQIAKAWKGPKFIASADEGAQRSTEWIEFYWRKARVQTKPCLLALDEIQKISNWSETIKVLFDKDRKNKNLRVILSGSASLSLQKGLNESLAGRYELIRCPHWGFDECAKAFGWDLEKYLQFGGYPAAAELIGNTERWQNFMRDSIVEPVLGRDLQTLIEIQKPALLRQTFELAMHYPSQEISYQKLLGQLQDHGNAATIKNYLEILEGGFLLRKLQKFSAQPLRTKSSSPKIIPMAPALIHAFTNPSDIENSPEWFGRVFECAIGAHLSRLPGEIYYWRQEPFEVDFIHVNNGKITALEVKSGRNKNTTGLMKFLETHPDAEACIVNIENGAKFLKREATLKSLSELQNSLANTI
jgi:predicted AAA+ superfamily ATPase